MIKMIKARINLFLILLILLNKSNGQYTDYSDNEEIDWELETATIHPSTHFTFLKIAPTLSPLSKIEKLQMMEELYGG
jgi:hypothetical protein